jgi:hypothetical protein
MIEQKYKFSEFSYRCMQSKGGVLERIWVHSAVIFAFLAFVHINEGIVVGDRAAHVAVVHGAQLCYVAAFLIGTFIFVFPWQHTLMWCVLPGM